MRPGDTLQGIAQRELNNQGRWQEIQTADGTLVASTAVPLQVGQLLYLPVNYQIGTGKPYNLMGGSSDPNLELSTIGDATLPFFKNIGSTPSIVVTPGANPSVDIYVRGTGPEYSPYQRTFENGQWSAFNKLNDDGGRLESDPLVVALSNGHQGMFVRGSGPDYALYYKESVGGQDWSASWTSLGGKVTSNPSVVVGDNGRIDVFVRGTGSEYPLYQMTFDGQNWGGWTLLGGRLSSDPVAVKGADGKIHVFVRGAGNKATDSFSLYERTFDPQQNKWSAWTSRGGTLTSNPSVVSSPNGQIYVFARGTGPDYALYEKTFDGQQWQDWKNLGVNRLTSDPVAVISDDGRINVFFQQNGYIAQKTSMDGQIWSSVNIPSLAATSDPAVVASGNGRIDLAFREADYSLRYMRSLDSGATWIASIDLGGTLSENPFYLGLGSDRPWLFESAFNRYGLNLRNFQPEDAVYRSGSGWIQNFTNATEKVVLMLRDGANFAYALYDDYLAKYDWSLGYPTSEKYLDPSDGTFFMNFEKGRIARKDGYESEVVPLGQEPSWRRISSYFPELASLSDDQWDQASGDDILFDGNRNNGESRLEIKQTYADLSAAVLGRYYGLGAGYSNDTSYYKGVKLEGSTGYWHSGIDLGTGQERYIPVRAAVGGTTTMIQNISGNYFIGVKADDGRLWVYGHLNSFSTPMGQRVNVGDQIGLSGPAPGSGFDPHLHLEVQEGYVYQSTGGATKDKQFLQNVTVSPLQAYWEWRNR